MDHLNVFHISILIPLFLIILGFIDSGNGNKTVGYYSNHNVYFATPPCDYGVASSSNFNSVSYSSVSSFF